MLFCSDIFFLPSFLKSGLPLQNVRNSVTDDNMVSTTLAKQIIKHILFYSACSLVLQSLWSIPYTGLLRPVSHLGHWSHVEQLGCLPLQENEKKIQFEKICRKPKESSVF